MTDASSQFDPTARRTLAAIVFTDIANASRLMGDNEEHTLTLVARDLDILGGLCRKHSGRVLKNTGDGLLMYFSSAVQAVACALEVQGAMGAQAKTLPPADVLMHRIGIHLGDVFVSENDVMGDGVNIAARLQSEAEPGGICISETVYDVVKNRLALKATYLGPRELKNIKDAVPVYQILLEAASQGKSKPAAKTKGAPYHVKPWLWAMTGLLILLCAASAAVIYHLFFRDKGVRPPASVAAVREEPAKISATNPDQAKLNAAAADQARINAAKPGYIPAYDFAGMMAWMEKNGLKDHPAYDRYSKLKDLMVRMRAMLLQTTPQEPITLDAQTPQGSPASLWCSPEGELILKDASGQKQMRLEELPPAMLQSVVAAALRGNPGLSRNAKLREAQQILAEELATTR